jgi:hypothetical protein
MLQNLVLDSRARTFFTNWLLVLEYLGMARKQTPSKELIYPSR